MVRYPHTPNKDVQSYLIIQASLRYDTLFKREILSVHANRLQEINMYIGLPNSDLGEEAYPSLIWSLNRCLNIHVGYILPASENHHHAGTGMC